MKKTLLLVLALVVAGLLVAVGVGVSLPAVQAQPSQQYTTFLPIICHNCDPLQPPSSIKVTKTLVQPTSGVARLDDQVQFKITVTNNGGRDIVELPLDDVFDIRYLEFIMAAPAPDVAVAGTLQWRDLTSFLPRGFNRRLAPGQSFDVTVQFRVVGCPAEQPVSNQAVVSGAIDDAGNELYLASASSPLTVACLDLEVGTPPARTQAYYGEQVDFLIVLRNTGNSPIVNLPLDETYDPTVFQFVSASPSPTTSDLVNGKLTWNNLAASMALAPGQRVTVSLTLMVIGCPSAGETTTIATVDGAVARVTNPQGTPVDFALPPITSPATLGIPCAELKLDKTIDAPAGTPAHPGDLITFTLHIDNTGNKSIARLPVQDIFDPALLDLIATSPSTASPVEGHIDWDDLLTAAGYGGYLMPGQSISAIAAFRVASCPDNGVTINRAKVSGAIAIENGQENQVPTVSDSVSLDIACPAQPISDIQITKTLVPPSGGTVLHNDLVTFTVSLKNVGYKLITILPLEDEFDPQYLQFVQASIPPDSSITSPLKWLNLTRPAPDGFGKSLEPGEAFTVTLTFKAYGCPPDQTTANVARVTGAIAQYQGRQFVVPPVSASAQMDIVCSELMVTKQLTEPTGGPALIHEPVVFSVNIENTGNKTVTSLPLEDDYNPLYLEFKSSDVATGTATPGQVKFSDLTQVFGDLVPGGSVSVQLTFEAIGCPPDQTTSNQAKVEGAIAQHGGNTYNVLTAIDTAIVRIACPDVLVTKSLVSPADGVINRFDPNDTATFQITIQATGNKDITTLPLEDNFDPTYLEVVSASPTPNIKTPGALKWNDLTRSGPNGFGGELKVGETFTVTVTVRGVGCPANQVVTNYAEVKGAWGRHDGQYFLVEPSSDAADVRVACPAVKVTKTPVPLVCGVAGINDPVTFNVMVENIGNTTLEKVTLLDTYSSEYLHFDSAQPQQTNASILDGVGSITWNDLTDPAPNGFDRNLPPGQAFNVVVNFTAIQSTQALFPRVTTNFADVSGVDEYGHTTVDQASSHVSVGVSITDADLFITKQVKPDSLPTHPGGLVTYQVTYGNNGPDNANFIRIQDTIPAGTEFVSDTLCGHVNTGCYLDNLAAGAGGSFDVTIRVPFGTMPGTIEENRISIESGQTPDGPVCGIPDRNVDNNVAGASSSVLVDFSRLNDPNTYSEDFTHEWLGATVLGETSPPDGEAENDGWLNKLAWYRTGRVVELDIQMSTAGQGAARYGSAEDRRLYLRAWVDLNQDGVFSDDELVLAWSGGPGMVGTWDSTPGQPMDGTWPLNEPTHRLKAQFTAPFLNDYTWVRFRLGYGNPPAAAGVEHYGEIEDHWVGFFNRDP
jgi:uncharacterized repeat protein (TIGR01451 family)